MPHAILVPLDGSSLSEAALNLAIPIAQRDHATLETITVFEPPTHPARTSGAPVRDPRFEGEMRAALAAYAEDLGRRLPSLAAGVTTSSVFREGPVAQSIADYANERGHDLLVMTTHGRSGPSRLWLGSVADRLARTSAVPILLLTELSSVRPPEGDALFHNVILPLDGSAEGARLIDEAVELAGVSAKYHLIHVIVPMPTLPVRSPLDIVPASPPDAMPPDLLGAARDSANRYLEKLARRLRRRAPRVSTHVLIRGSPAQAILEYVQDLAAPLVAMPSRGRGTAARMLLGSVTDKVVRGSTVPVLTRTPVRRRRAT